MTTPTLPKLTVTVHPNRRAYYAALRLVAWLDPRPNVNTAWRVDGRLVTTLDEAVRALLEVRC